MYPGIFLDRDGVLIEYCRDYILSIEDVSIYDQALKALASINKSDFRIVMITNQSAIGRGLVSAEVVEEINQFIISEIEKADGRVDGVFVCPHKPDAHCGCRKPNPGLILQAAKQLNIDLSYSVLIGDNFTDLQAGEAAGVGRLALVRTGLGTKMLQSTRPAGLPDFEVFDDLEEALQISLISSKGGEI